MLAAAIFIVPPFALGQEADSCPTISVDGPSHVVKPGEIATYTVRVDKRGLNIAPVYKWSVSAGSIVSGQGTERIDVRSPSKWNTTVTVEVEGVPVGCPNIDSWTGEGDFGPKAKKIGEFTGSLSHANFSGVIDAAERDPSSQLYIIVSGASRNRTQSITNKRRAITSGMSRLDKDGRITFVESTRKDDRTAVWLVPPGATPPVP